ncbi:MAG: hypothetical protein HYX63_01455 [Gammaproteobacteria bacterium]|nr:hypothetical protein [Gammaproteobacteria bacterium]
MYDQEHSGSLAEIFGEPISTYTRAQAIEDGFFVDVSETALEAGFKIPVAITSAAWADCVAWTEADNKRQTYQDESGRLWDVLWMARCVVRQAMERSEIYYRLLRVKNGGRGRVPKMATLKMMVSGGDNGEPVITIMLPGED